MSAFVFITFASNKEELQFAALKELMSTQKQAKDTPAHNSEQGQKEALSDEEIKALEEKRLKELIAQNPILNAISKVQDLALPQDASEADTQALEVSFMSQFFKFFSKLNQVQQLV